MRSALCCEPRNRKPPNVTAQFDRTAVKLSQGPLGIIALFIVLIHGFASLVLGLAGDIGESNRSILVWFLVSFPVGVFTVFASPTAVRVLMKRVRGLAAVRKGASHPRAW